MKRIKDNTVLLFYKEYETDVFFRYDRYLKRILRPIYHKFKRGHKSSGFKVWFFLLVRALRMSGYDVHTNDYLFAKNNPEYPVGLFGYPILLENWSLSNPAILGPGLYDHPKIAPDLMKDHRYKRYLVTCDWMQAMFRPYYGEKCVQWFAGIDTTEWPDTRQHRKSIDVLIYDKIRWNRELYIEELLQPITALLENRGLRYRTIQYMHYDHASYKEALLHSKTMIFLCEHETQGLAYQEALASNLPILAWDNGFWLDPSRPSFEPNPIPATSVPYFSSECGERFQNIQEFFRKFDQFWECRSQYQPRCFVERALSLENSARLYAQYYFDSAEQKWD